MTMIRTIEPQNWNTFLNEFTERNRGRRARYEVFSGEDIVEARPKGNHPLYSRRVLYIDLQTDCLLYSLAYDHTGAHKRTFINVYYHPAFNPWANEPGIPQYAAQASLDYQWDRAGIFQVW